MRLLILSLHPQPLLYNIWLYKLSSRDKRPSPWILTDQTHFSTPKSSQIPLTTSWNWGRTGSDEGWAARPCIPNKEGANICKYIQMTQFQYFLTFLASFAPNLSQPLALDAPHEWLSVSTKFDQIAQSRGEDIEKQDWALYWPGYFCVFYSACQWNSPFPFFQRS